jgi:SCP-2 sterol transfer family
MSGLIARVVALMIPWRFDPAQANELELRVRRRPIDLAIAIADGACTVTPGSAPGAGAAAGLADLIRLILGDAGWPQLLSSGRLRLSGDPFLAMRIPALFRLPVSRAR